MHGRDPSALCCAAASALRFSLHDSRIPSTIVGVTHPQLLPHALWTEVDAVE